MRVAVAIPEAHVTPPVLDAALEAVTRLNEGLIKAGEVPMFDQVRESIRWKPEPPGDEHFDHAGVVLGRKWGDCDDMAPYAAASMRASGEDPGAKAVVKRSGPKRWHAVVERSDGTIRDPSKETGMGQRANGVLGAALPMMMLAGSAVVGGSYILRPQLALRPVRDRFGHVEAWQSRADLPWHWLPGRSPTDVAMSALHASPVSSQAIVGACNGIVRLGEENGVDDDIIDRAAAIRDAASGADWDELADEYGEEHATAAGNLVGSLFGGIARGLSNLAAPVMRPISRAYDTVSPYTSVMFPGTAQLIESARAASTLDPQAYYQSRLMPGVQSGRDVFERNPLGRVAYGAMGRIPGMSSIPGMGQWLAAARPRQTVPQAAFEHASDKVQDLIESGRFMPPPGRTQMAPGFIYPQSFG